MARPWAGILPPPTLPIAFEVRTYRRRSCRSFRALRNSTELRAGGSFQDWPHLSVSMASSRPCSLDQSIGVSSMRRCMGVLRGAVCFAFELRAGRGHPFDLSIDIFFSGVGRLKFLDTLY